MVVMLAIILAGGCSREPNAWARAERHDTIAEYQSYLKRHPQGPHAAAARGRLDDLSWKAAAESRTVAAIDAYLKDFPSGAHVEAARNEVEDLRWAVAERVGAVAEFTAFARDFPQGRHLDECRARIASLQEAAWWDTLATSTGGDQGKFDVQVATFAPSATAPMHLNERGQIDGYPPGTTFVVTVRDTEKASAGSVTLQYTYADMIGTAAVFTSKDHGAIVVIGSQILIPVPTSREIAAADDDLAFRWKRAALKSLHNQVNGLSFDQVRSSLADLGLLPLPAVEKWLSDPKFESLKNAAEIRERRRAVLKAVKAAGSIGVPAH